MNDDGQDWNDEHPWNVPADASTTGPSWWNAADWGFNEWNRTYKAESVKDSDGNFSSVIMVWGAGNGGQTITLADSAFTPVRSQSSPGTEGNVIRNSVAYDYDYSESGYANAWDSPFNFAYKMYQQKLAMVTHFKAITDADPAASTNDAEFPNGKTPSAPIAWEVNSSGTAIKVTNGNLNSWNGSTEAPMHFWKFYWKEASNGHQPYIPGLGLYEHDTHVDGKLDKARQKGTGHEINLWISDNPLDPAIQFNTKKSAGTDCIGFVERTASYRNTSDVRNENRIYSWQQFPEDRAEKSTDSTYDNDAIKRSEPKAGGGYTTKYGEYPDSKSEVIVSRAIIKNMDEKKLGLDFYSADITEIDDPEYEGPSEVEFDELVSRFLTIVPGDVIYYGHTHIGEIAYVDYSMIRNATTINQLMQAVVVIECVYNGKVNYVIKRNMLGGSTVLFPSLDNLSEGETQLSRISAGSWMFGPFGKTINDLRNWEIRRLK